MNLSNKSDKPSEFDIKSKVIENVIKYFKSEISYEELMEFTREEEPGDDDLFELLDMIEHEPKKGGFGGLSTEDYLAYRKEIQKLVSKISKIPSNKLEFILSKED